MVGEHNRSAAGESVDSKEGAELRRASGAGRASPGADEVRVLAVQKSRAISRTQPVNIDRLEPELHVIGQVTGFKGDLSNAFAAFRIMTGSSWEHVGAIEGIQAQTQVDYGGDGFCIWNHPIDAHWFTSAMQGWPRILFQLFSLDAFGGWQHEGYSVCWLPYCPGRHRLECAVWRPTGTPTEEVASFFLGVNPSLTATDVLLDSAKDERCKLVTVSVGTIICELDLLTRNFHYHRIDRNDE